MNRDRLVRDRGGGDRRHGREGDPGHFGLAVHRRHGGRRFIVIMQGRRAGRSSGNRTAPLRYDHFIFYPFFR